ncbi:hypothetical protein ACFL3U_04615 [Pseudomonadota bacterium]
MNNRSCFPCTACCDGWLSSKYIEMSPGHPCTHSTNKGCSIYETRPEEPCRTFKCAWLNEDSLLPDHMRPDQCGAIVMIGRKFKSWRMILATPTGWTIPQGTLEWIMSYAKKHSIPLVYIENLHKNGVYTHFKRSGYGPLNFVQSIQDSTEPLDTLD